MSVLIENAPRESINTRDSMNTDTPRQSTDDRPSLDAGSSPRPDGGTTPTQASAVRVHNAPNEVLKEKVDGVLQSDAGVSILLTRLKQSIAATKDFAFFLKKRSSIEEEHAQSISKLMAATQDAIRRPDSRQGSFAQNYWEITTLHDRMSKHGLDFALTLQEMSDDLQELAANAERQRKQWKQTGLAAETRARDSVGAMQKAKEKSYSLADQYDRARTGEKTGGRFGLKKGGANAEDDMFRKAQGADQDYAQKVQTAQNQRGELLNMHRPQTVKALNDLITECDSGLHMQMQKFAALNERLALSNGLCLNPLNNQANGAGPKANSLRDMVANIDHPRDLHQYVLENQAQMDARTPEIRYEKHHALTSPKPSQMPYAPQQSFNASQPQFGYPSQQNQGLGVGGYDQGPRPGPPGQVSGVTTYPNRDGQPMPNQYGQQGQQFGGHPSQQQQYGGPPSQHGQQFGGPPPQSQQQYGNAPSLPPLDLMGGGGSANTPGSSDPYQRYPQDGRGQQDARGPNGLSQGEQRTVSSPLTMHRPNGSEGGRPPSDQQQRFGEMNQRSASGPGPGPGQGPMQGSQMGPGAQQFPTQPPGTGPTGYGSTNSFGPSNNASYRSEGREQPTQDQTPQNNLAYRADAQRPPQGPSQGPSAGVLRDAGTRGPEQSNQPLGGPVRGPNGSFAAQHTANSSISSVSKPASMAPSSRTPNKPSLPPNNPVFGISLEDLFRRDGSAVPTIIYQCVQAVDLFGLNVEGIYRTSGSAPHIMEMKALFDHDSSQIDFRYPTAFHNDIASVTTLLKHFLRDLPDPLLTAANYSAFIQAAKIDDDIVRRDSLHAIINSMPDPNYATLRVLSLHLTRVAKNSERNRMTPSNLAICFGPTLMGGGGPAAAGGAGAQQGGDIRDAGWQARVVETILVNTLQIFDDDE